MRPSVADFLAAYPPALVARVKQLIEAGQLAALFRQRYPAAHEVRSDRALYDYVEALRSAHLRGSSPLSKVVYDGKLQSVAAALGTHTRVSRVQGGKLKAKREIRIASVFRAMPEEWLRMIVVHELAHLKEPNHDKGFYSLCQHMEPDYATLEFDLRAYLSYLAAGGAALWGSAPGG